MKTSYRPDIDGLRAVAVISVIFYHFEMLRFSGGFVGVDVFFVISGYLITGIVAEAVAAGRFDPLDFFARRARRLLPALFATILVTFILTAVFFLPRELAQAARASLAATFGLSNVLYWMERGYFDTAATVKPLLHTWSLAVELQFYLVWPFVVAGLARRGTRPLALGLGLVTAAGLAAALAFVRRDMDGAFYLMPFRVWEFAAGGLVWVLKDRAPARAAAGDVLYLAGAALVMVPVFAYSRATPFPGLAAVPPVLGAALMIWTGQGRAGRLLALPPAAYVGRLSYSLYLVHWPAFVIGTYAFGGGMSTGEKRWMLLATAVSGLVLHAAIETPFRQRRGRFKGVSFAAATAAMAGLGCILAADAWRSDGWTWRYASDLQMVRMPNPKIFAKYLWAAAQETEGKDHFTTDKTKILVIGDSQAADFVNVLTEAGLESQYEIIYRTVWSECGLPYAKGDDQRFWHETNLYSAKDQSFISKCRPLMDRALLSPATREADIIALGFLWRDYAPDYIGDIIATFRAKANGRILLIGLKSLPDEPDHLMAQHGRLDGLDHFVAARGNPERDALNRKLAQASAVPVLDMTRFTCPTPASCPVVTDDQFLTFSDSVHFTREGILHLLEQGGTRFLEPLEQAAQQPSG